ncbi:hypothetical protein K402DRAFT_395309 [Aulographum hederae CBS 113979]|uniref:Uncharacterized protein n=1 Tax=Aulographum hederae CBS 113979 TaxID=1176131 RepID=A0A6G1GVI3_9PEZI|nr:hypothetical protein K402DRAFT_395309 [Aulographum hederae CBS 113979]
MARISRFNTRSSPDEASEESESDQGSETGDDRVEGLAEDFSSPSQSSSGDPDAQLHTERLQFEQSQPEPEPSPQPQPKPEPEAPSSAKSVHFNDTIADESASILNRALRKQLQPALKKSSTSATMAPVLRSRKERTPEAAGPSSTSDKSLVKHKERTPEPLDDIIPTEPPRKLKRVAPGTNLPMTGASQKPASRGPGRPKKAAPANGEQDGEPTVATRKSASREPGRPKQVASVNGEQAGEPAVATQKSAPRRRGQPPKNTAPTKSGQSSEPQVVVEISAPRGHGAAAAGERNGKAKEIVPAEALPEGGGGASIEPTPPSVRLTIEEDLEAAQAYGEIEEDEDDNPSEFPLSVEKLSVPPIDDNAVGVLYGETTKLFDIFSLVNQEKFRVEPQIGLIQSLVRQCQNLAKFFEDRESSIPEREQAEDELHRALQAVVPPSDFNDPYQRRLYIQETYTVLIPCLVRVLRRAMGYHVAASRDANTYTISELDRLINLVDQIIRLIDLTRDWTKDKAVRPASGDNIVKPIRDGVAAPLRKVKARLLKTLSSRQEAAREKARQAAHFAQAERQRKREEQKREARRLDNDVRQRRNNLYLARCKAEPSFILQRNLIMAEDYWDRDLDADGVPFERSDIFEARTGPVKQHHCRDMGEWNMQVPEEEHLMLTLAGALEKFQGPQVFHRIFAAHCGPGGALRDFTVLQILRQAWYFRTRMLRHYAELEEEAPAYLKDMPDLDVLSSVYR